MCAVALVVAGSWAKPAVGVQAPVLHLAQIDHVNSLPTTGHSVFPGSHPSHEFDWLLNSPGIAAAKIRNSSATIALKWANVTSVPFTGYVKVHEARYVYDKRVETGPPVQMAIPVSSNSLPISIYIPSNSISAPIQIALGNLPNYVVGGNLQLKVEVRGNFGFGTPLDPDALAWGSSSNWNDFGVIFLTAQAPADIQGVPWLEVLEEACWFAQEKSTEPDIRQEITKGIFFHTMDYEPTQPKFTQVSHSSHDVVINLSKLYGIFGWAYEYMNCVDGASLNVVMCEALGFDTQLIFYKSEHWPDQNLTVPFLTQLLCPAGKNSSDLESYDTFIFSYHCVAYSENNVYDGVVANRFDLTGNDWLNPVSSWYWDAYAQSFPYGLILYPYPFDKEFSTVHEVWAVL